MAIAVLEIEHSVQVPGIVPSDVRSLGEECCCCVRQDPPERSLVTSTMNSEWQDGHVTPT